MSNYSARTNMVKQQLRTGDVLSEPILALYEQVPRHEFVPKDLAHFAYSDVRIPLPHEQSMLTPLEEASILQALDLKGTETVLEVGTGTGFFTALLSRLCQKVISVDYYPEFTAMAKASLAQHHCDNVELITADASRGFLELAPYDVVIFTGAIEQLTEIQTLQVVPGGSLFAIVGKPPVMHGRLYQLNHQGGWKENLLFETNTPLLINPLKTKVFVF